ncbi:MAG: sulfatase-like hydrolase/transferase [Planctomycetaceae bacterium]
MALLLSIVPAAFSADEPARPNILLILADDMGYGDPQCYNPNSKCPTPQINSLASAGLRFTDAHSAGSVCVPSRYGLLTGRYPFRARLDWTKSACIEPETSTIAARLQSAGYRTGMVGKWHLGFDGGPDYDYSQPLVGGPCDRGFDSWFGIPHSLDIQPYYLVRDRLAIAPPTQPVAASNSPDWSPIQGVFWREGKASPGFEFELVLDQLGEAACDWLKATRDIDDPFFLYVPLTSPHTPWLPAERFRGQGGAGLYGEFVAHRRCRRPHPAGGSTTAASGMKRWSSSPATTDRRGIPGISRSSVTIAPTDCGG